MILVVNFNLVENALLEKVSTEVGIGDRVCYVQSPVTTPDGLAQEFGRTDGALPRVVIMNLDSYDADWKALLENMKADDVWRFIPVLGFGFLENSADIQRFYELGGSSCIRKPHGYEGLKKITETTMGYWLDVSFMPCDFMTDAA